MKISFDQNDVHFRDAWTVVAKSANEISIENGQYKLHFHRCHLNMNCKETPRTLFDDGSVDND
jgi:hypothetical protein